MSPRPPSSQTARIASSPYARRPASHPKSSRQQFSACGACRMRRVRCDLKDLAPLTSGTPCSNCKERGLNCVDEYAEIKSVKLLRRGRRLQQVEAIYGKVKNSDGVSPSSTNLCIPALNHDFFSSPFWPWFCIQRPVLDPNEFPARYLAHVEGTCPMGNEGVLLSMILVLWAASFGLDESGSPIKDNNDMYQISIDLDSVEATNGSSSQLEIAEEPTQCGKKRHRQKIRLMLQQILELVDSDGIMRRPTLDGVRILLLVIPLMEEFPYLERSAMYEAALSHTRILCNPRTALPWASGPFNTAENGAELTRVIIYAQIQEGIASALKGGRPILRNDDIDVLQKLIDFSIDRPTHSSPMSTTFPTDGSSVQNFMQDKQFIQLSTMPLHLSSVCCKIHDVLTGLKATRRVEEHGLIDATGMREIWHDLEQCWQGFVSMKTDTSCRFGSPDIDYFTDMWLIFIFECHNIILESLKRLALAAEPSENSSHNSYLHGAASRPSSNSSSLSPYLPPRHLYLEARVRCIRLLPRVMRTVRCHLAQRASGNNAPNLFTWDTGLVRDGCLFAGLLAAELYGDVQCLDEHEVKPEETDECISPEEGVHLTLSAFAEMRWAFSKAEEHSETVRSALERSKERHASQPPAPHSIPSMFRPTNPYVEHGQFASYSEKYLHPYSSYGDPNTTTNTHRRPHPTLNIGISSPRRVDSAPNTACSTDGTGSNGWPTYTPPATASTAPVLSSRGSPGFQNAYKTARDDAIFYYVPETLDNFAYTVTSPQNSTPVIPDTIYPHRDGFYDPHSMHTVLDLTSDCLGSDIFTRTCTPLQLDINSDSESYVEIPVPE